MKKIVGPSGIHVVVAESVASGLVNGGHCTYVTEAEVVEESAVSAPVAKRGKAATAAGSGETSPKNTKK